MVRVLVVVLLGLGLLLGIPVAHAFSTPVGAQIIVTTTADVLVDDGLCSLREAIQAANLDAPSGTMAGECVAGIGDDIIVLGMGTYEIEIEGANEDQNLTGDLDIWSSMNIIGQDAEMTNISGNQLDRVLEIHAGTILMSRVSIVQGLLPNAIQNEVGPGGAGIYNAGTLFLEWVTIRNNRAGSGNTGDDGYGGGPPEETEVEFIQVGL